MNKHNRLLAVLNDVFGMENILKSQFRKVGQDFDEKTNEYIFYIEYRVRGKGELVTTPTNRRKQELLRQINDRVKEPGSGFPLSPISDLIPTQTTEGWSKIPPTDPCKSVKPVSLLKYWTNRAETLRNLPNLSS